ncbi:XRE family transcriptional regulator [Corticibacter populi]|uniref:XRE family transcriptional regulator n=1 Tax=Corticibacter populi TaxID=1550736 RepID=A0A3M6QYU8_9BURK|nr:helix-turn-helix transcriptional regulator [Corticibacter populi]RMX08197.1 XRE family transcriptional regulator [Corticibacter populi]RZS35462.1 helix-turn-helix protein [Corticibacter populi]
MTPSPALPIRTKEDLGRMIRQLRLGDGIRATDLSSKSGRSRDLLHRLESGRDVTTGALLDVLSSMGYAIRIEKAGLPTLDEMRQRFADEDD